MSRGAVVGVVAVGLIVPSVFGLVSAPLASAGGAGWEIVEGAVVFVVFGLAELVALRKFGAYVRRLRRAEALEARNARIRQGLHASGQYSEPIPL